MKKSFYSSLLFSSFALFSFSSNQSILANNQYSDANPISVRIEQSIGNPTSLNVQLMGNYTITSPSDKTLNLKMQNQTIKLTILKSKLMINSDSKTYSDLKFTPFNESPSNLIKLNNNLSYIGTMDFTIEKVTVNKKLEDTIQPRNTLRVDNYLLGVVPHEMPSDWAKYYPEAVKAQTVSARTYLHQKMSSEFNDTVEFQVYKGYKTNKLIEEIIVFTADEVLLYKNRLIEPFYSSSNGGFVNSTQGYGWNPLDYSVAKCDPFDPKNSFTSTIDEKTLIEKVLKDSSVKEITKVTYSAVGNNGRPSTVYFDTNKGQIPLSINVFRNRLDYDTLKNTLITSSSYDGNILTINGYGWGHGVGMNQYGAKVMAQQKLNYKQILGFYYSGVSLNGEKLSYTPSNANTCAKFSIKTSNTIPSPPPNQNNPPQTFVTKVYTVNTKSGSLNLRQSAATNGKILTTIPKNKTVKFLKEVSNKWYHVEYNGKKGYVSKDYIKVTTKTISSNPSKPSTNQNPNNNTNSNNSNQTTATITKIYTVNTKSGSLNLRQTATTNGKVLATIPKGKVVKFLKEVSNKWYHVEYNGKKGYASKDYIKVTSKTATTKPSKPNNTTNNKNNTTAPNTHIVVKGDTLYSISKKYGVNVNTIISLNKLKSTTIKLGQSLKIK